MGSQCASIKSVGARRRDNPYGATAPIRRTQPTPTATIPPPDIGATWKKLKRFVKRGLTTKERLLITLHYCENLTMAEIGAVLEMPESRVVEIHRNVLSRVKTWVVGNKKTKVRVA